MFGASMFRGVSELSLDSKGRLAIPTRHRDLLFIRTQVSTDTAAMHEDEQIEQSQCVITIDTQARCLLIYPFKQWEVIEQQIQALPSFNAQARKVQRLLLGHATEIHADGNGRVLIPPPLRDFAGLDKQVVLVGQGKKFELWDKAHWEQQRELWLKEEATDDGDLPPSLMSISL